MLFYTVNNKNVIRNIVEVICLARNNSDFSSTTVYPLESQTHYEECFTLFTKPELFLSNSENHVQELIEHIFVRTAELGIVLAAARVISPQEIRKGFIIDRCYERLSLVSTKGLEECSVIHRQILDTSVAKEGLSRENIFGGDQALERYPDLTVQQLGNLVDSKGCHKFGAGIYGTFLDIENQHCLILNGFYPAQREWLSANTTPQLALAFYSDLSPKLIREMLVGDIFPHNAGVGSLRRSFHDNSNQLGLLNIGISRNCIHYSANSLDAALYQEILFGCHRDVTPIAQKASRIGIEPGELWKLYYSKNLRQNERYMDLRDMIEDVPTRECLKLVHELVS